MTRHGKARQGLAWVVSKCGTPVPLVAFREGYERGLAGQGMARHGKGCIEVRAWSRWWPSERATSGARRGKAGRGRAWQGLYRSTNLIKDK